MSQTTAAEEVAAADEEVSSSEEEEERNEEEESATMVVGMDDSEQSYYALQWTLGRFFRYTGGKNPLKLVIVHAKPTASSVVPFAGPGAADVIPFVESDLKKIASGVLHKAREICTANKVSDAIFEVMEGDPRNVLCDAVDRHHAEILVVGSHGYGVFKRAVLGSVSDYCAHHAHCTVMIVKKPKQKH